MGEVHGRAFQSDLGLVDFCILIPGQDQGLVGFPVQVPQGLVGFCNLPLGKAQGLVGFQDLVLDKCAIVFSLTLPFKLYCT